MARSEVSSRSRSAATVLFAVFATLFAIGLIAVVTGATAVVILPFSKGRAGVGTAMITLFSTCVCAIMSAVLLRSARRAARVVRGDTAAASGLSTIVAAFTVLSALATALAGWLFVAFFRQADAGVTVHPLFGLVLIAGPASAFLVFAACAAALRSGRN